MYQRMQLSHEDAMKMIDYARSELEKEGKGAAVAVVDEHGELIAFLRTDGCRLTSIYIAMNKAYTAAREQIESKELGKKSMRAEDGFPMTNFGELRYVTWGGGYPIIHDGVVIGAIGISGLPEEEDMKIASAAAKLIDA